MYLKNGAYHKFCDHHVIDELAEFPSNCLAVLQPDQRYAIFKCSDESSFLCYGTHSPEKPQTMKMYMFLKNCIPPPRPKNIFKVDLLFPISSI